jgi:hypothetical protein
MIMTEERVECIVLQSDCKFYDGRRYINPKIEDVIELPEYEAKLEVKRGVIEIVEYEEEDEDEEASLKELKEIRKLLSPQSGA